MAAAIEDMVVDHGRADVLVPQEFLDGPDVVAAFQQMRGEEKWVMLKWQHARKPQFFKDWNNDDGQASEPWALMVGPLALSPTQPTNHTLLMGDCAKLVLGSLLLFFTSSLALAAPPFDGLVQMPLAKLHASLEGASVEVPASTISDDPLAVLRKLTPVDGIGPQDQASFAPTLDGPFEFTPEEKELLISDLDYFPAITQGASPRPINVPSFSSWTRKTERLSPYISAK